MKNENGFSLIELAVSTAILTVITLMAATAYSDAANDIENKVNAVKEMQAANPDTLYLVEFN